jgi:aldose 1-epimerase
MATVTLSAGDDRCEVDAEAGGRLASLVAGGQQRLLTRETGRDGSLSDAVAWGSFLMAPWVGRLDAGRLPWQGRTYQLPIDFGEHAIHGTVKDRPWTIERADETAVTLSCPLEAPWPFGGEVRQVVTLAPGRLDLEAEVLAGAQPMPAGLGWHPWFARPATGDVRVRLAATGTLDVRDDLVPTGQIQPLDTLTDLRSGPELGERVLDHIYAGVGAPAEVVWPDLVLTVDWADPVQSVCVHSPPRGFCVEPQTEWPNAPVLAAAGVHGTGQVTAQPGIPLRARTTWTWRAA